MPNFEEAAIREYTRQLRLDKTSLQRLDAFIWQYRELLHANPEFIFIEDQINEDGNREFVTTVLLTRDIWAEGWFSRENQGLYITSIRDRVLHIAFERWEGVNDGSMTSKSSVAVRADLTNNGYATFGATGLNCAQVFDCIKRYFLPNLINLEGALSPAREISAGAAKKPGPSNRSSLAPRPPRQMGKTQRRIS